ncbi:hypothetical protein BD626DRAFT_406670 [Schizophyllum amplum]|uniref:F-box domain-containing protein n=1 Tax=Schizophyllum amplum TaxID=97359 RepID=A0A550C7T8_9AGAR|nr:hypothetical protein BD626DRAFT_406670 [Auriculariopsis ampla]
MLFASPDSCDDLLCSCLETVDLLRYALVCRDTHRTVMSYRTRAFDIRHTLRAFFSDPEIIQLRETLGLTGAVISGSVAVQFFDRCRFAHCDLDLYVERHAVRQLFAFLVGVGYTYRPKPFQPPTIQDILRPGGALRRNTGEDTGDDTEYDGLSICGVFNFRRPSYPDAVVQVLVAKHTVVDVLLGFHSTVVMNVITHRAAYSLYPRDTFIHRVGWQSHDAQGGVAYGGIQKYRRRGWNIQEIDSDLAYDVRGRAATSAYRVAGDDLCWIIPFDVDSDA